MVRPIEVNPVDPIENDDPSHSDDDDEGGVRLRIPPSRRPQLCQSMCILAAARIS